MPNSKPSPQKLRELEEHARRWGNLLIEEAFPQKPGEDVSLEDVEDILQRMTNAMVSGAVENASKQQAEKMPQQFSCPQCGKLCRKQISTRQVVVQGGEATLNEIVAHCWKCRRNFFPSKASPPDRRPEI